MTGSPIDAKTTYKTGKKYGFSALLYIYTPDDINSLAFDAGAHIFITNETESLYSVNGIEIAAGSSTSISIQRTFADQLPSPFNDCYESLDSYSSYYYDKTVALGYTYKQKDCINLIEQKYFIDNCNCSSAAYPTLDGANYCKKLSDVSCIDGKFGEIYSSGTEYDSKCPRECSTQSFQFTVASSYFPADAYGAILMNQSSLKTLITGKGLSMSTSALQKSLVMVNVFYEDMKYSYYSESEALPWLDLMSNVGGIMGLYIGISFLSFVEIVEVLMQLAFLVWEHNKRTRKVPRVKPSGNIPIRKAPLKMYS